MSRPFVTVVLLPNDRARFCDTPAFSEARPSGSGTGQRPEARSLTVAARWSAGGCCRIAIVYLAICLASIGCGPDAAAPAAPRESPRETPAAAAPAAARKSSAIAEQFRALSSARGNRESVAVAHPLFTEIARQSGIEHTYLNGATGLLLMVEPIGGGCGWIDFDRDGQWDLYLNQGGDPVAKSPADRPSDQLFRNLGGERFEAVTVPSGLDERGYSQGIAIGDFDNDGFDDIFVTNVGADVLFKNQGDGTFIDVTATLGSEMLWGTSAAWADIDLDGDLDLYVCNYCDFDPYHPIECRNARGVKIMCEPNNHVQPVPDECFLNEGDGTFRAVAREKGLVGPGNRALGVAIADFNNDAWPDIFVANDTTSNFLFINRRDGTFADEALVLGCGVSADGQAQANMGIAVGDYDHNGWLDAYITHFEGEWNTLYRNDGAAGFQDVSGLVGLVPPQLIMLGFGTVMHDFNQDGREELFVANGHLGEPKQVGVALEMPPQCFTFDGCRWHECSAEAGDYFEGRYVGRGAATADFDNDGDLDLVVAHQNSPAALLRNDSERGHWLKFQFVGRQSNRNGIGVRVTVRTESSTLLQELAGGTSYCAAHQPVLVFGLGASSAPCRVEIRWPGGAVQLLEGVDVDQTLLIVEPAVVVEPAASADASGKR
jgi:hypothetical protein